MKTWRRCEDYYFHSSHSRIGIIWALHSTSDKTHLIDLLITVADLNLKMNSSGDQKYLSLFYSYGISSWSTLFSTTGLSSHQYANHIWCGFSWIINAQAYWSPSKLLCDLLIKVLMFEEHSVCGLWIKGLWLEADLRTERSSCTERNPPPLWREQTWVPDLWCEILPWLPSLNTK